MPSRSRPFYFTLYSKTGEKIPVAINGEPAQIDAPGFTGLCHIVHETGSETGLAKVERSRNRGLIVQMQGKFAETATLGEENSTNIWLGGTLGSALNLGWVMRNVVSLGSKFANKKTGGRFYIDLGNEKAPCQMGFHLRALFRVLATPEGEEAPRLGSPELDDLPYGGPGLIEVDTSKTYTLYWKIPYLDLCTWELLKVPAISPLPLENVLGDLSTTRLFMYDLGKCGAKHPDFEKCILLEATFERGAEGDEFYDPRTAKVAAAAITQLPTVLNASPSSPKKEIALPHEVSIADSLQELAEDLSEENQLLRDMFAQTLQELPCWQGFESLRSVDFRVPFYIEAISRFRKQEVRSWYIVRAEAPASDQFYWQARDAEELAVLCHPKRRLSRFIRGAAPRNYRCCSVKTLEQFRIIVGDHLAKDSKLRSAVLQAANAPPDSPKSLSRLMQPPPRFFEADGAMCGLAFAQAAQEQTGTKKEALVGAVHFEGRICEELLRLSSNNTVRCFSPYDCDQPRVLFHAKEILQVEALPQKLLNRFHLFEVQTNLRVYVFCCAGASARDEWVAALMEASRSQGSGGGPAADPASPKSAVHSIASAKKAAGKLSKARANEIPSRLWPLLDVTGARRWADVRYVLNDRLLTSAPPQPLASDAAGHLLEQALALGTEPSQQSLTTYLDSTCMLKTVRFTLWSQSELKAFWLNVYHCLLLHGLLVLPAPDTQEKWTAFRQRASYLVGLRPVSLADIEAEIFRLPKESVAPPQEVGAINPGGCCGLFVGKATVKAPDTIKQAADPVEPSQNSRMLVESGENTDTSPVDPVNACLYLDVAEAWEAPSADPRLELGLALGSSSCSIPVFRAANLDSQLDEAARLFVQAHVETEANEGELGTVSLPAKCRALKRHFKDDKELLHFLWKFQSSMALPLPDKPVQVKYRALGWLSSRAKVSRATMESETPRSLSIAESGARDAHVELLSKGYGSAIPGDQLETLNVISL
ncbi:unnamed protein product [Symbiodinium natans]|uniref:DUF547 domain-containing protein n=1 Tax=Symbiodinium natans TaxID=878477 RepID=A0A812MD56_9DINO|nr:unnamed protein product [Symbiodinium natans]